MKLRLQHHLILLVLFAAGMAVLWMLPVYVMGYPYTVPNLAALQAVIESGTLGEYAASRLLHWLLAPFSVFLNWQNPLPWLQVNAAALAVSLLPFWWAVYRAFTARIAWATVLIFALMPVHWEQALWLSGYAFAYIFLFLSLLFFVYARQRAAQQLWWLGLAGVCFGLALATRDTFILFLPGIVLAALYVGRADAGKTLLGLAVFLGLAFSTYSAPLLPQVLTAEASPVEKVQLFIGAQRGKPNLWHFYPDPYTYEYEREAYLERVAEESTSWSALERLRAENYMQVFGASERTLFSNFMTGTWLFLGALPLLIAQDYVGGVFLWLFIVPGALYVYRKDKKLLWLLVWLIVSMMLTLRFVFLAQRTHIMDYGWILALLAGVGAAVLMVQLRPSSRRGAVLLGIFLPAVIALQLLQANRSQIARVYQKSNTLDIYAATQALETLPEDAVVAHSLARRDYFYLTQTNDVLFSPETLRRLEPERLQFALDEYGVTHAIGYGEEVNSRLPDDIRIVEIAEQPASLSAPSRFIEMLLHWFR